MMAIERIGASLTAQAGTIGPLSTILMAVVLLGEPFTAWVAAGTVLVIAGIWLLAKRPQSKMALEESPLPACAQCCTHPRQAIVL
jgi:drug/metabolite transporter (DMT)-like permease